MTEVKWDAAAAKLNGQIAKLQSRFGDRDEQLKETILASRTQAEEVRTVSATLNKAKDTLLEELYRVAD